MNAAVKVVMGPATLLEGELEGLSLSERLPGEVVYTLLQFLDVQDLGRLAQTCTELRDIVYASDCWESLCVDRFGSILMLQSLVEEAGIPLPAARQPPSNWRNEYMRRLEQPPVDLDHIAAMYDDAQSRLQDNAVSTPEQFTEIAQILLSILDAFPEHYPSYYTLGHVCFVLNAYDAAEQLVELALELAPGAPECVELLASIQRVQRAIDGVEEGDQPLLDDHDELSEPLRRVLGEIFTKYDADKDGALNRRELSSLIERTNGVAPAPQLLAALTRSFASTRAGALKLEGFLAFYLAQTQGDPEETISDLAKHGYNRQLKLELAGSS